MGHACKMTHQNGWSIIFLSLTGWDGKEYFHLYIFTIGIHFFDENNKIGQICINYFIAQKQKVNAVTFQQCHSLSIK